MLEDTLKHIDDAIRKIKSFKAKAKDKAELVSLLDSLKDEVARLSETHGEQARSIAGFADVAAHEATRRERSEDLLDHSLEGLSLSAKEIETSHPEIVEIIDQVSTMLSRIGI